MIYGALFWLMVMPCFLYQQRIRQSGSSAQSLLPSAFAANFYPYGGPPAPAPAPAPAVPVPFYGRSANLNNPSPYMSPVAALPDTKPTRSLLLRSVALHTAESAVRMEMEAFGGVQALELDMSAPRRGPGNSAHFYDLCSAHAALAEIREQHVPQQILLLVPLYMAAQLAGAMAASFTLRDLLHPVADIGTTTPARTATQALVMEIVVTFSMMFVTSAVATDTKAVGELAGLAVGSAVCITSIVAGPVSGGSMNPARSIGPALASDRYDGLWVYVLGPFLGTLMGCGSYSLIRVPDGPLSSASSRRQSCSFKLRRLESHGGSNSDTTSTT